MEEQPVSPPENADEWSSEQWIEWLNATDADAGAEHEHAPITPGGRVAHSTGGQLLGSAMLGLARALYGPQAEKPAIVVESGEPDDGQPFDLHLDYEHPERSFATRKGERSPLSAPDEPTGSSPS